MNMSKAEEILQNIYLSPLPKKEDLEFLLSTEDKDGLELIFNFANRIRKQFSGDGIILRGIIEFSNFCANRCFYCGLNVDNLKLTRYRLSKEELLESVKSLAGCNIKTVVLQSGEDNKISAGWLAEIIRSIKSQFDTAITLCVGERPLEDYKIWRDAGADRYLLKIETTNKKLYESMHPGMSFDQRLACLKNLKILGYQVGSGNIIGLKNQALGDIAQDIIFFKQENFDMLGIGPFIPHADTKFSAQGAGSALLTLKTLALTRIVTKNTHLPATTALGSLDADYRVQGLNAGANVLMPNFTPQPYRKLYEIYPGKICVDEPAGSCNSCMEQMAAGLGRHIDYSRGDALKEGKV